MAKDTITIKFKCIMWPFKIALLYTQLKAWLLKTDFIVVRKVKMIQFDAFGNFWVIPTTIKADFTKQNDSSPSDGDNKTKENSEFIIGGNGIVNTDNTEI